MPRIVGLTEFEFSKMPDIILETGALKYFTKVGKLILRTMDLPEPPRDSRGSAFRMYEHYSIIYSFGRPIGFYNGEGCNARDLRGNRIPIPSNIHDITREELIHHKDSIFYNDDTYDFVMERY